MFKYYLKVALRNIFKNKAFSFINITGLSIGLACAMLILLYVQDDYCYDRFHKNADRIYRVALDAAIGGKAVNSATTPAPTASAMIEDYPEVLNATRIWDISRALISYENNRFYEDKFMWADPSVFEVFSFPLLKGDPKTALSQPNSVVIAEQTAQKYFGTEDPMGKILRYDNRIDYKVTGVMQNIPHNSHLQFDFLASIITRKGSQSPNWLASCLFTYILLKEGADPTVLEAKFPAFVRKYTAPQVEQVSGISFDKIIASGAKYDFYLQSLPSIHLHSVAENDIAITSDIKYVYILSVIAVFILIIASVNFMNLSTAKSSNRAKEVGLRKVLGSIHWQLISQFLSESVLLAMISLVFSALLIEILLPLFNNLAGKELSIDWGSDIGLILSLVGIALITGLLAGVYPAFVLSTFRPVNVLKGSLRTGMKTPWLRGALVILQFSILIGLLIGTGIVFNQLKYMQNKPLGFSKAQVIVLPIETKTGRQSYATFRKELMQHRGVINVMASDAIPGHFTNENAYRSPGSQDGTLYHFHRGLGSHNYLNTLQIELAAGRNFSREFTTDAFDACIINESAARQMGLEPNEVVGKQLNELASGTNAVFTIIGVMKDFHFESLHKIIKPILLRLNTHNYEHICVRVRPENMKQTLSFIKEKWQAFEPDYPYRYFFLDEYFGRLYQKEERLGHIFVTFTILAVFIACLGLFCLASFTAEQRTKEIGIRKVLGSSVSGIVTLLIKDFTKWVLVANIVSWPIAYYAMNKWLQNFTYRVNIGIWVFILSASLALIVALITVSYQSIKAALANPVESLRYE